MLVYQRVMGIINETKLQDGAPKTAKLRYGCGLTMVYGRYFTRVNMINGGL